MVPEEEVEEEEKRIEQEEAMANNAFTNEPTM